MNIVNQHSPIQLLTKLIFAFLFIFSISIFAQDGDAKNGKKLFNTNCAACHKLDKKVLGPPLKGVTERRERKWLHDWIKDSGKMIKAGDKVGIAMLKEYNNIAMTPFPQLSDKDIEDILAYTDGKPAKKENTNAAPVKVSPLVAKGKKLYKTNCAACHKLEKKLIGPALKGIGEKREKAWLHAWIKDNNALRKSGDALAKKVFEDNSKQVMSAFPQLSDADIDAMLAYFEVGDVKKVIVDNAGVDDLETTSKSTGAWKNWIVILLILGLLIWMFLSKITFLKIIATVFLLLAGAWFGFGALMELGVDQGYQPYQPIEFSHKIHAGDNKIDCQYCHSSAKHSKTSGIPTANVCMNCHKAIDEVAEDTKVGALGKKELDLEIKKIYNAVGWDPDKREYIENFTPQPIEWVRVHNLPDFAYYNHSQHVTVAGLDCQTCHGAVEEMDEMRQHSKLTMGWCLDCHKKTDVNLDNKYYAKIHEDLSKKYGVESFTIADIGGKECAKCHY